MSNILGIPVLVIQDNGIGYDKEKTQKSFGLILVTALVEAQLAGVIDIEINSGVKVTIVWREENEKT